MNEPFNHFVLVSVLQKYYETFSRHRVNVDKRNRLDVFINLNAISIRIIDWHVFLAY